MKKIYKIDIDVLCYFVTCFVYDMDYFLRMLNPPVNLISLLLCINFIGVVHLKMSWYGIFIH